jgi:hypothetical protein
MTAAGWWAPPGALAHSLPRKAFWCAWEEIPWPELSGRSVAVIGAGASGFDNASCAVEAGCTSVTVFGRGPFPGRDIYFDLWRGRDDSDFFPREAGPPADILEPLLAHNGDLNDAERLCLMRLLFRHGRSPANPEYLARVPNLGRIAVRETWPVDRLAYVPESGMVNVHAMGETFGFDRVIFATGMQSGLEGRPELARWRPHIVTWADQTDVGDTFVLGLERCPKLSRHYQLQPRSQEATPLENIYCLADAIHVTVGLQSASFVATAVADHIGSALYKEQLPATLEFIGASADRGWPASVPAERAESARGGGVTGG